jgi:DNA primase
VSAVDDVKARLDIVDVVGGYVPLRKAGRYFKAPCPFHSERTPSFIVNPERQTWHCFGACATGGDVISFVARKENLDFVGALRLLADRAGVELRSDPSWEGRREQAKGLQDANEAAAIYFQALLPNTPHARAYAEERGLDRRATADFQIGYAPAGWEGLRDHLTQRGFSEELLVEAGLLIVGERGTYDRFRDRLMFPIRDDRGRVVGFGGRLLPVTPASRTDPGPKYMNTPQTPIFDKGGVLYGLDRAAPAIRQGGSAVIVEGYMDVIAAHQHGFANVVAAMGTSLTERQVTLCERNARRVVLAMDADNAGSAATLRDMLLVLAKAERRPMAVATSRGIRNERRLSSEWHVAVVPRGKDPDEFIRANAEGWRDLIDQAAPMIDHYYRLCLEGRNLSGAADRQDIVDEMLPVLAELTSAEQAAWFRRLSRGSRPAEEAMWRQLRAVRRQSAPAPSRRRAGAEAPETLPEARREPDSPSQAVKVRRNPREEFCLALLYRYPELSHHAGLLSEDLFTLSENRELFRRWRDAAPPSAEEDALLEHERRVRETRIPLRDQREVEGAFSDCVERLQQVRMRAVKEASALALAEGEAGVRPGQVASIAHARLAAGAPEPGPGGTADGELEAAASALLEDMEAGLRFHRRLIEDTRSDQAGRRSAE